jgi:hypothetical protein
VRSLTVRTSSWQTIGGAGVGAPAAPESAQAQRSSSPARRTEWRGAATAP